MTDDLIADAFDYLLDDMEADCRVQYEARLARFPAARIALLECTDSLAVLRRQAADVPFFGQVVDLEVQALLARVQEKGLTDLHRVVRRVRQIFACHV